EAQYLQAQKMETVGRLAGGVAHDFNNLLTVINGYSDLLLKGLGPEDASRASLMEIRKAGDRAAGLTRKLLAFSRKQLVQPKALDLNLVVMEAETMYGRLVGEDIELITRLGTGIGEVMADAGQMHQVLMNLVVNARDSMPNGGTVTIETKNVDADETFVDRIPELAPGPYVYLGITDTGTGMSDEVKQHLFEPFFTTKEPGKGTGLGLATIYGIVHQSGGWIGATSEPGHGTTFHIYLPRIKPGLAGQPGASPLAPAVRGSETVMVVEDVEAVRRLATTVLEGQGYCVLQASNGPDAIALAEQYPKVIHLLLTDVILPLMDGRALAHKLRAARPEIAVLYISGYTEERIGQAGVIDRNSAYLPKPFTPDVLAARVRKTLADAGSQPCTSSDGPSVL
ncbi:MAG: ATP-binding protein, partial [Candidatus Solibacter sp.]|nr:ATP-binding protein [Candidatus Solibacter sp.]